MQVELLFLFFYIRYAVNIWHLCVYVSGFFSLISFEMRSLFFVLPLYYSYSFCASSLVRAVGAVVIVTQICLLIYLFCFTYDIAFVPFSDWLWIVCVCVHMFFFVCSFSYYILFCRHRNRRLPYTILHNKFSEENRRKEKGIERSTISWMIIMIQSLIRQFSHFDSCYISFYRFATKFIIASLCISFSFHFISLVMFGLLLIIFKHASDTNPQQQKPLTIQNKFTLWKISLERETKNKTRNSTRSHIAEGKSEVGIILQYEKLWK